MSTWTHCVTVTCNKPFRLIALAEVEIIEKLNAGYVPLRREQTGENSITIWFGRAK